MKETSNGKVKTGIKFIIFVIIGVVLFLMLQELFRPRWNYPKFHENTSSSIDTYLSIEEEYEQAIFIGTSHMLFGMSPLKIYEDTGIVSYNLATSAQSIEGTYYLIQEALETQSPEVIVMDVSNMFFEEDTTRDIDVSMRYILDSIPLSLIKLRMAYVYANLSDTYTSVTDTDTFERFLSAIVPFIQYHSRWTDLGITDFRDYINPSNYYTAGYYVSTRVRSGTTTVEEMNDVANALAGNSTEYQITYEDGVRQEEESEDALYDPQIPANAAECLWRIKQVCEENNCELLLVKIPSINSALSYSSAWTEIKSNLMKTLADSYDISFLDMVYDDVDLDLDLATDFSDGGNHLNIQGAEKVSSFMGQYLATQYNLTGQDCEDYNEKLEMYQSMTDMLQVEMEYDFVDYLSLLKSKEDQFIISIAVKDEASTSLTDEEKQALNALGLQTDFTTELGYRNSYLAVIDGGNTVYEATSNREISYQYSGDVDIDLTSSGYLTSADASIRVDGTQYARDDRGFNIVVVDKESGLVIDSVSFDTFVEDEHLANRKDSVMLDLCGTYEQFQIQKYK